MARLKPENFGHAKGMIVAYVEWSKKEYEARMLRLAKAIVKDRDVSWRGDLTEKEQTEFVKRAKFYASMILD